MQKIKSVLSALGLILGTTIGAGIFALPHVFYRSGWPIAYLYLAALSLVIIFAHYLLLRTLSVTGKSGNLAQLLSEYFDKDITFLGNTAIIGGIFLTLVAFLVLGTKLLTLILPGISPLYALIFFWLASSVPLIWEKEIFLKAEFWGSLALGVLILFMFFNNLNTLPIHPYPQAGAERFTLPFGVILFALAGWTAMGPMSKTLKNIRNKFLILSLGTLLVSSLYALFVYGIFYSAADIASDTFSGLTNWSSGRMAILVVLGLFAIWTSYLPGAVEIRKTLQATSLDRIQATALVFFLPLFLIIFGMSDFIRVVALAGGVFLSMQYFFIFLLARKVLRLKGLVRWLSVLLMLVFALAAIYETYYFFT